MTITIAPGLPLQLGYLQLHHCQVASTSAELQDSCVTAYRDVHQQFAGRSLAEDPTVQAVRQLFRAVNIDPTRYRPSSEALLRRITKTQTLPWINNIVDINNVCSVLSALPIGAYDADQITGDITIRLGQPGEQYTGLAKQFDIAGKIIAADTTGPFGAPIGDSDRTKITTNTKNVLVLIFCPSQLATAKVLLDRTLNKFSQLAERFAQANTSLIQIIG